ncbi:hypothetical protein WHR41_02574 [Cladosporium halotolerans]|uniref:Uncharacterized protein n=1 Tax=Cladosporium halotolerans TaxID=1052096 RepID=A0AB34KZC3_9PEZI
MSAFCEDDRQLERYPNGLIGKPRPKGEPFIRCLQWGDKADLPWDDRDRTFDSVQDLTASLSTSRSRLRVVLLPLAPQQHDADEAQQFRALFRHYSVPSAVPAERMRNVSHAFGASRVLGESEVEIAWFHFLCRNVFVDESGAIRDLGYLQDDHKAGVCKDPSMLWIMCDFFLHVEPAGWGLDGEKVVTLLCFGAPSEVVEHFQRLLGNRAWSDITEEPYLLFEVLFNDLHEVYDQAVWKLSRAVNPAEREAVQRAGDLGKYGRDFSDFSFRHLNNIQKNCVFMVEAGAASIATLDAISAKLKLKQDLSPSPLTAAAADAIEYRRRNFHSTSLRLHSVEQRILNVVQMTRTMVTQADSAVLKADSRAMKFIAALTLIFLPATGVASVFDTPFFDNDFSVSRIRVATNFWVFWAVDTEYAGVMGFA